LDLIQAAEEKAEKKRLEANEQVKTLMEETQSRSESEAMAILDKAKEEAIALEEKTRGEIVQKGEELFQIAEAKDLEMLQKAEKQAPKTIDFILKKVMRL
jgi:vacuolar-type H+-ATPase subunit H